MVTTQGYYHLIHLIIPRSPLIFGSILCWIAVVLFIHEMEIEQP